MKNIILKTQFLACALALLPALAPAQEKTTVAIAPVKPTPSLLTAVNGKTVVGTETANKREVIVFDIKLELNRITESMDSQLMDRLNATRKFEVVTRSDLADLLKEQDLGASGNLDAKTVTKTGKISGAKYLLVVTVDDFQDYLEKASFEATGQTATKRIFRFSVVGKLYDPATGKLVESANYQMGSEEFNHLQHDLDYTVKTGELSDQMLAAVARTAAEKIASHLADAIYPAKIVSKRDHIVTLNRGEGGGVAAGDIFNVYALGEPMTDPDTKEPLGREEVRVGKVKITEVGPKTSQAEILEDTGIDLGAMLRRAK